MYFERTRICGLLLLICWVAGVRADDVKPEPSPVLKIASKVLDENVADAERVNLIRSRPEYAADLLQTLVEDIEPGTRQESARIPWLWEISVVAVEKYNPDTIARMLDIAIPQNQAKVADWQIAVVGGGLIFQLSKSGREPRETIEELVGRDPLLKERWNNLVKMSQYIVLDPNQSLGIRYDALRIFAMSDWSVAKQVYEELFRQKYIATEAEKELRLAAVAAVPDFNHEETTEFFVNRFSLLSFAEREKVCRVLSRNETAATRLLRLMKTGAISKKLLNRQAIQCFRASASERVRKLAATIF